MRDILREAGHMTLGSRLKRLGERLQAETQAILSAEGFDLPAAQHPVLLALDRLGPSSIGALARALGQSQPGMTRMAKALEQAGLIAPAPTEDRRIRRLALTEKGRQLVDACRRGAWRRVEEAARQACSGLSGSLLDQLAALEDALDQMPLERRAAQSLKHRSEQEP